MRITTNAMARNLLLRLNTVNRRGLEYQEQIASGKRINKPSDDPVGANRAFRLRTSIAEVERYAKNVGDARDWLLATEEALRQMVEAMHRVGELATSAATDTVTMASLDATAKELDQIQEHLVSLANSDHGGRYLFAGQNTLTQPFTIAGPAGVLDVGAIYREVGPGQVMQINITPEFLDGPNSVLALVPQVSALVKSGDTEAISAMLTTIQAETDELLSFVSETGAKINRLDMISQRLTESNSSLTRLLSDTEDAEFDEILLKLSQEEASYKAALAVGARLIQPTLVDFLQ
ncbi:MAG: flagellar hook-associated protein FlgL [Ignavibacteriales bacterium]